MMHLSLRGQAVTRVSFDYGVSFLTDAAAELRIETAFDIGGEDAEHRGVDPADAASVTALLVSRVNQEIADASVNDAGRLQLLFGDGVAVRVPPSDDYEAWSFVDADQRRVICLPGGEIATWESDE